MKAQLGSQDAESVLDYIWEQGESKHIFDRP